MLNKGSYEIADRFIAGNVIEKAERIEEWLKENPDHAIVRESLEALKASFPEPIAFEDLDFNFGERWIPTGVYSAYMSHLFNTQVSIVYSDSMDEYSAKCSMKTMAITDEYMVKGYYKVRRREKSPRSPRRIFLPSSNISRMQSTAM